MVIVYYKKFEANNIANHREKKYLEKKFANILDKYIGYKHQQIGLTYPPFFSKSHCLGMIVIAYSDSPVGCDVEVLCHDWTIIDISKRVKFYLSTDEIKQLLCCDEPYFGAVLAWTRKESYYKVHKNRKIQNHFCITQLDLSISNGLMKFTSVVVDSKFLLTCYTNDEENIRWIEIE